MDMQAQLKAWIGKWTRIRLVTDARTVLIKIEEVHDDHVFGIAEVVVTPRALIGPKSGKETSELAKVPMVLPVDNISTAFCWEKDQLEAEKLSAPLFSISKE